MKQLNISFFLFKISPFYLTSFCEVWMELVDDWFKCFYPDKVNLMLSKFELETPRNPSILNQALYDFVT